MKTAAKYIFTGLLIVLLAGVPAAADAHGGFGGGAILGFGLGLFTGFAFAPRPVYVGPTYYVPPPPLVYEYYPAPIPPDPTTYGYSNNQNVLSANPPTAGQSSCREWRLINRHWVNRWDAYSGRWRVVLVEKWGWAAVPCNN